MEVGHCVVLSNSTSYYVVQRVSFYRRWGLWMKFLFMSNCIVLHFVSDFQPRIRKKDKYRFSTRTFIFHFTPVCSVHLKLIKKVSYCFKIRFI